MKSPTPSVPYFCGNFVLSCAGNSGSIVKRREEKFTKKRNATTHKKKTGLTRSPVLSTITIIIFIAKDSFF